MKAPAVIINFTVVSYFLLLMALPVRALEPASFDFMGPAYCFAGNERGDPNALGGYGPSDNLPKKIDSPDATLREGVYLEITGDSKEAFVGRFEGLEIRLVNNGKNQLVLPASDSRIELYQEALDTDGQWKLVEFFPSSWCGNSRHNVYLKHGQYFAFVAPKYSGPMKTKLRFKLEGGLESPIVSKEYDGGIHPQQFVREKNPRRHNGRSIMDPHE
jgi:hypothetical protein